MKSKIQTLIGTVVLFGGIILLGLALKAALVFFFIPHEEGNFETDFSSGLTGVLPQENL